MTGTGRGGGRAGQRRPGYATGGAALLLLAAVAVLPAGCGHRERPEGAAERPVVAGVEVATAEMSPRERMAEAAGTVRAAKIAAVSSQAMGRITAVAVEEGDRVEAGELLVAIDDVALRARLAAAEGSVAEAESAWEEAGRAVAQAEAAKTLAENTFDRFRALHEERVITRQEFDEVEAKRTMAVQEHERALHRRTQGEARIAQARAQVDAARAMLSYTRVDAPFAGIVTERKADAGSMAVPGMHLVTLEDTGRYRIEAAVPEARFGVLTAGLPVRVALDSGLGEEIAGKVAEVVPAVDPASRTFVVKVDLPRGAPARTGMFGRVRFPIGKEDVITVPREAISTAGGYDRLFTVGDDNVARLAIVKTGQAFGDRVEILSGIAPGTRVAVSALDRLADGARVEVAR